MQQIANRAQYAPKRSAFKIKTCPAKKPRQKNSTTSDGNSNRRTCAPSDGESSDTSSDSSDVVQQTTNKHGLRSGTKREHNERPVQHSSGHIGKQSSASVDKNAEREKKNTTVLCQDDSDWTKLIAKRSLVNKKYPQSYCQQVDIKGACPFFRTTVLSHSDEKLNDLLDEHQLETTPFDHKIEDKVKSALGEYAAGNQYSAWTSKYLALALNMQTSNPPKDSQQTLFLSQNKPPVILVLCWKDEAIKEAALAYAGEMARALTTSLLNYCHCEFILLACAVSKDTFSTETLREKIEEKRKQTSKMYYRRQHLSRSEYRQLKKAVTIVSRVSPVRHHLADSCDTRQTRNKETRSQELVILDEDWYNLVLYFINKVMQGTKRFKVPHPSAKTVALKVKVAAKEAGRRLGAMATCTESHVYLEITIEKTTGQR
ncbi:uncharacterized protein [Littorina saxatilis]|uniref:uncharacterized protein n=1 Tax=Littorina saxatilis TaxID=31220 RepID=UPI0038B61482